MKNGMFLLLALLVSTTALANTKAALEESLYYDYQKSILSPEKSITKSFKVFSHFEQKLYVNALEDLINEGSVEAIDTLEQLDPFYYELDEQLRIALLKLKTRRARYLPKQLVSELESTLEAGNADLRIIYLIASYEDEISRGRHTRLLTLAQHYPEYYELNNDKRVASAASLRDLFYNSPDLSTVLDGRYQGGVKLFMFCRTNRLYPCLMILRDARGDVVRDQDGSLWSQPSLASSKRGLPSYTRNGNTPTGVMTIDSVMPVADQQISFGKYRRLILEFINRTPNEEMLKTLLPVAAHSEEWWKAGTVARDVGRDLLRIHGTGKKNDDASSSFWPFMQTSGCIAQRENTYGELTFVDQRLLLDKLMNAMDLEPVYANETKIKGLLYITEIDSKSAAVTIDDLQALGIQ